VDFVFVLESIVKETIYYFLTIVLVYPLKI